MDERGTVISRKIGRVFYCQPGGVPISWQALEEEMKPNQYACGEPLMTRDEIKRASCWSCAGFSWRLTLMDRELATLEAVSP